MRHPKALTMFARGLAGLALGLVLAAAPASATPISGLVISEILFDSGGPDNGRQWIEIYNGNSTAVDLSQYSILWGRNSLANSVALASVMLAPGSTFLIGGPASGTYNGTPTYDQVYNFGPDLYDGSHVWQEDAVALLYEPTATVMHIVVYGGNGFVTVFTDEQGALATAVDVNALNPGQSLEYQGADTWLVQGTPTPGLVPVTVPEPATGLLVGLGVVMLAAARSR